MDVWMKRQRNGVRATSSPKSRPSVGGVKYSRMPWSKRQSLSPLPREMNVRSSCGETFGSGKDGSIGLDGEMGESEIKREGEDGDGDDGDDDDDEGCFG